MLIEKIVGNVSEENIEGLLEEKILLDHYDIAKPHQKIKSERGNEYAISLPQGENLSEGSILYRNQEKVVFVVLKQEDILEIKPEGNMQWGMAAFNIGNMHKAAFINEESIKIPYDGLIEKMMKEINISTARTIGKLDGKKANYTHGHHHSHEHNHSHGHGHE